MLCIAMSRHLSVFLPSYSLVGSLSTILLTSQKHYIPLKRRTEKDFAGKNTYIPPSAIAMRLFLSPPRIQNFVLRLRNYGVLGLNSGFGPLHSAAEKGDIRTLSCIVLLVIHLLRKACKPHPQSHFLLRGSARRNQSTNESSVSGILRSPNMLA